VNTHFHWDHWQGNEVYPAAYPGAEIITNDITREAMLRRSPGRIADHVRTMPAEIAGLEAALAAAKTPDERARIGDDLRQAREYLEEIRALRPAVPTIAFENSMRLVRGDREVELLHLGRAHTAGDVFTYLPKEQIVVTGDAVVGWTPYMGDGYPEEWAKTLDRLGRLDFTRMILGHGDVAGREWLEIFRGYVADLVAAVRREAATGATLDEIKERVPKALSPTYEAPLSKYGDYRPWRSLILGNIERLHASAL
jgi:glyoxylase-like metal-dependent hydrolase (beta-lactamase superfamily II)